MSFIRKVYVLRCGGIAHARTTAATFRLQVHGPSGGSIRSGRDEAFLLGHQHLQQQRRSMMAKGEVEAMKKQSPAKKKKESSEAGPSDDILNENKNYKLVLAALDASVTKPPPASEEEMKRRKEVGRKYTIGCFERNNQWEHELSCKIRMKNHAIQMLSKRTQLRKAALEINDEGPPPWRRIPVWTPPIPGFNPDDYLDDSEKESL